jgi:hypothetical protein
MVNGTRTGGNPFAPTLLTYMFIALNNPGPPDFPWTSITAFMSTLTAQIVSPTIPCMLLSVLIAITA